MRTVASRTNRKRGQGKRTRRALIRLRHALAAERFMRWAMRPACVLTGGYKERERLWHQWHALGCP